MGDKDKGHPALELPASERADYLVVVASIASVDGVVHDDEISKLRRLCKDLTLSAADTGRVIAAAEQPDKVEIKEILKRLKNASARYTLVTDLMFMAYADGKLTSDERKEIDAIAESLSVTKAQLQAIEKYVKAVGKAGTAKGVTKKDLKKLGGDVLAGLASAGVPVGAVAVSGSVFGLSAAGITSGLAALGMGLGMAGGIGAVAALGVGSFFGVRWVYRKVVKE